MNSSIKQAMFERAKELSRRRTEAEKQEKQQQAREPLQAPPPRSRVSQQKSVAALARSARRQELSRRSAHQQEQAFADSSGLHTEAVIDGGIASGSTTGPQLIVRPISRSSYDRLLGFQSTLYARQQAADMQVEIKQTVQVPRWS